MSGSEVSLASKIMAGLCLALSYNVSVLGSPNCGLKCPLLTHRSGAEEVCVSLLAAQLCRLLAGLCLMHCLLFVLVH